MNDYGDPLPVNFSLSAQAPGRLSGINPANSKTYNKDSFEQRHQDLKCL
jgi:hypothetical protein